MYSLIQLLIHTNSYLYIDKMNLDKDELLQHHLAGLREGGFGAKMYAIDEDTASVKGETRVNGTLNSGSQ